MKENDIPYGVGVLVAKDGKFLCGLRKDTGEICGPGGHLEKDESPEQAAVRETREEFGITPKKLQCLGCLQSKTKAYLPTMVFLCTDFEGEPKTDSEEMVAPYYGFNDIADLERKDAKLYPAFEDSLSLLEDCINGRSDSGKGSGNFGHSGRPGMVGGSGSSSGAVTYTKSNSAGAFENTKQGKNKGKNSGKITWVIGESENRNGGRNKEKIAYNLGKSGGKEKIGMLVEPEKPKKIGMLVNPEKPKVKYSTAPNTFKFKDFDYRKFSKKSHSDSMGLDGGAGSGNWGHSGRPGLRGGSGSGGGIGYVPKGKQSNMSDSGNKGKRWLKSGYGKTDAGDIVSEKKDNSGKKYVDKAGNLSKGRDALHTKIMDDVFFDNNDPNAKDRPLGKDGKPIGAATPVGGQARLIFMGGGPASGKSSVIASGDVDVPDNRVQIDPDRAKKALPEYQKMVAAGDIENAAGFAHEESSALAKRAYEKAAENNMNVCYDGTGDGSVKSVEKKLATARANGMKVEGVYVTCSTEEAIKRSDARAAKTGRKVNHETIRDTHKKVSQILPQVADKFDTVSLYDTGQGGKPVLIATGGNGKGLTAVKGQEKLFQAFLDKANE